jgi:hypothetical protein
VLLAPPAAAQHSAPLAIGRAEACAAVARELGAPRAQTVERARTRRARPRQHVAVRHSGRHRHGRGRRRAGQRLLECRRRDAACVRHSSLALGLGGEARPAAGRGLTRKTAAEPLGVVVRRVCVFVCGLVAYGAGGG